MARDSGSSGHVLVDVLDRVLDKGIVIDAAVRVSIAGIELLGVDARVVVASIETYLRHADTLAYTDLAAAPRSAPPPPLYAEPLAGGTAALTAGEPDASDTPPDRAPAESSLDAPPDADTRPDRASSDPQQRRAPTEEPPDADDAPPQGDAPDLAEPIGDG